MTSPDAQARLKVEQSAWLVECPKYHPGEYFALCECGCGRHHWTKNVHNATKFATKEEAETARGGDTNCIAVDHLFGLTLPSRTPDAQPSSESGAIADDQIKHMVDRFLSWKLPENFNPDCGITAVRPNYGPNVKWEPSGTNLLDAMQAEAMVRHMVVGLSQPSSTEGEVERVARAIERAWSRNHASIKSDPDIAWRVWTPEAEAAIAAQVTKP